MLNLLYTTYGVSFNYIDYNGKRPVVVDKRLTKLTFCNISVPTPIVCLPLDVTACLAEVVSVFDRAVKVGEGTA